MIVFEDFSKEKIINGNLLNTDNRKSITFIHKKREGESFINIESNSLSKINEYSNYANHINNLLVPIYLSKAEDDILRINKRYQKHLLTNEVIIQKLLSVDRFISTIDKEKNLLKIHPPTIPIQIYPKLEKILPISIILGLIIGIFVVILNNTVQSRRSSVNNE